MSMTLLTHRGCRSSSIALSASLCLTLGLTACARDEQTSLPEPASADGNDDDEDDTDEPPAKPTTPRDAGRSPTKPAQPDVSEGPAATPAAVDAGMVPKGSDDAFCKVLAVMETKCGECHSAELAYGAPMPLATYEDFTAAAPITKGKKVYEQVGARIHDTAKPMPPKDQPKLTAAEIALVDQWVAAKAPAPSGTCAPTDPAAKPDAGGVQVTDWPVDCEERHKFLANDNGKPHSVPANYEGYVDFTFTVPWKDQVQAVAFRPTIDNKKVLHHWILYQGQNSFLNGWSPGKPEKTLPLDVGVHMPANGTLKMTTHYNNKSAGAKAELDSSGVEVCVTRKPRKNTAFTFPFTASATAPAGRRVDNVNTCTVKADQEIHLVTSSPHMHKLGVHAKFEVIRADGTREVITDKPFDFEEQTDDVIDVVVKNGDKIATTCSYMNDTGRTVNFGQNTDQEMCFNFALYYPMCAMTCTGGDPLAAAISASQGGGCPR
jgi:mono/diheme cytochrome c family protein